MGDHADNGPADKGDEETRKFNERVRDYLLELNKARGWEHDRGGRKWHEEKGKYLEAKELYVPNPHKDFDKKADGRKGSRFVDLTFRNKYTGKYVHVQTVDVDKHGNPTKRELDAMESISERTGDPVWAIRKPFRERKKRE